MKQSLIILLLSCMLLLSACQPTPEKPIVVQKDTNKMIEQATKAEDTSDRNEPVHQVMLVDKLQIPDKVSFASESAKGYLHLNVDAKTYYPDVEKMPIYRMNIKPFSQEQVDRMVEVFMQGQPIVTMDEKEHGVITQEQISALILRYQKIIAEERWEVYGSTKESYEKQIAEMRGWMADAPVNLAAKNTKPSDGQLITNGDKQTLRVFSDIGDIYFAELSVCNDISEKTVTCEFSRRTESDKENPYTKEDAKSIADKLLSDLGIEDMVIIKERFDNDSQEYVYRYSRMIDGSLIYNIEGKSMRNEYGIPWDNESIMIHIGAEGVTRFTWTSPTGITEKVTDDAQLLSFPEIKERIEETFFQYYTETTIFGDKGGEPKDINYNVKNIQLCYMRVDEQNTGAGLYIPVWLVCGSDDGQPDIRHNMNIAACSDTMLIINAIDGGLY